jgi:phage tail tube protein FII
MKRLFYKELTMPMKMFSTIKSEDLTAHQQLKNAYNSTVAQISGIEIDLANLRRQMNSIDKNPSPEKLLIRANLAKMVQGLEKQKKGLSESMDLTCTFAKLQQEGQNLGDYSSSAASPQPRGMVGG